MAKSKNNKNHKERVNNFKQKIKQTRMNQTNPQMPPVQSTPIWAPDAKIEVTGYEWEAIQNGLTGVQVALQASQSVMSRNIVNGTIKMDFEKLNPETLRYEPMTDEEKAPYVADFEKAIERVKNPQPTQPEPLIEVPTAPQILDANGLPATTADDEGGAIIRSIN